MADGEETVTRSAKRQRFSPSAPDYVAAGGGGDDNDTSDEQTSRPSTARPSTLPLEPSILNAEPFDEVMREIADWVFRTVQGHANIEVEGRVGLLIDTTTGQRLALPVLTETILDPAYGNVRFESNMSQAQHQHFNAMLNKLLETYSQSGYTGAKIRYQHHHFIDSFYSGGSREKLRVTRDAKTNKTVQSIIKRRLGDLNIYCPSSRADWRVSVNVEEPVPEPPAGRVEDYQRQKDRIAYSHQAFSIDLTQVKSDAGKPPMHELEIEFAQPAELLRFASVRGDRSSPDCDAFDELVRIFVNNCRVMIRNVVRWD